jgi:hypothetical protein
LTDVYRCLDHVFSVSADRPDDVAALTAALRPFTALPDDAPETVYALRTKDDGYWLYVDDHGARVSTDPAEPLDLLFWYVGEGVVRDERQRLILHAGAVVAPDGRALLMPGPSGSGKSTTTLGMVAAGMGYLSDEFAVVDPDTVRMIPFPRPLALKQGSRQLLPRVDALAVNVPTTTQTTVHVPVERLGGTAHVGDAEPGWVVFPTYLEGAETRLTPLTRGETCVALLDCTFRLVDHPHLALRVMADLARKTRGYRLQIGDLDEAVAVLTELTSTDPTTSQED